MGLFQYPKTGSDVLHTTINNLQAQLFRAEIHLRESQADVAELTAQVGVLQDQVVYLLRKPVVQACTSYRPVPRPSQVQTNKELWIARLADGTSQVLNELPAEPGEIVSIRLFKGQ